MKLIEQKMVAKTFVARIECDKCGIGLKEGTHNQVDEQSRFVGITRGLPFNTTC